jgi:Ca2+-binding RTX toxin-like protein
MALTGFKKLLMDVLIHNELSGNSPYSLLPISVAPSGWSFGVPQFDVKNNPTAANLLASILLNATDAAGSYIVDPANTTNRGTVGNITDATVQTLLDEASAFGTVAIPTADLALINAALASPFGQTAIDTATNTWLDNLISFAQSAVTTAALQNQGFLGTTIAQLFLCDFANQYKPKTQAKLMAFLQGTTFNGITAGPQLNLGDLLGFYFRTPYSEGHPWDSMRRFAGVVIAAGGYAPSSQAEAFGVLRAYTYAYQLHEQAILATSGRIGGLNEFLTNVVSPADSVILGWVRQTFGISASPNIGDVFVGADSLTSGPTRVAADNAYANDSLIIAGACDSILAAGRGNDILIGGAGNDVLIAGSGADTLVGSGGTDHLVGGVGYDAFYFSSAVSTTNVIIDDSVGHGNGAIWVNATQLPAGTIGIDASTNQWTDGTLTYAYDSKTLGLTITGNSLQGGSIFIQNFDINAAQSASGYLGLHLQKQLAIEGGTVNQFAQGVQAAADATVTAVQGAVQEFTISLSEVSAVAQTLTLKLSNAAASMWKLITGANTLSFAADGTVQVTIAPGQDSVSLALLDMTTTNQVDTAQLSATLVDASGTATSNNLTVTFDNPTAGPPTGAANAIAGKPGGQDTISGTAADDFINVFGTNNSVGAAQGGNDTIVGAGGQDVLIAGNGNNQVYVNGQMDLATALLGRSGIRSGLKGTLVAVGDGNNTIVGGTGNDIIFTGTGSNMIVCGPGAETVAGGVEVSSALLSWSTNNDWSGYTGLVLNPLTLVFGVTKTSAPFTAPPNYHGNYSDALPVGLGNDTIFGGTGNSVYWLSNGNNYLDAGGGNDNIFAGIGSNTIYGGNGNDTIWGGGGNNYINTEAGNDMVVAEGGNMTIIGGTGNCTIWSGDVTYVGNGLPADNGLSSETTANNYIFGGAGNCMIYGSGGNDTLIGGTGNTTILGGNGNESIVGGSGNVSLAGGSGNDTIDAGGNGNDAIGAGSGSTTIYGGGGSDTIYAGSGSDLIYAGDGGTALAPTQVFAWTGSSTIYGGAGFDQLMGGSGTDNLIAGPGTSTLLGGTGTEIMYAGTGQTLVVAGRGSDTLYGGSGTDTLQGSTGQTVFVAGSGNETINGGTGTNTYMFNAGFGNIELANATPADRFWFGSGINPADLTLSATIAANGQIALLIEGNGSGSITIDGGLDGAIPKFAFASSSTALTLDQLMLLSSSYANTVTGPNGDLVFSANGSDTLVGGAGNDSIYAWNGGNILTAGTGNQWLCAHGGSNLLTAGSGNDTLVSAGGSSTMVGGTGNTTFVVNTANDLIQAQATGTNSNTVLASVSYVSPDNIQNLILTGSDNLVGTSSYAGNTVTANSGNDTLIAGNGVATLVGGSGNDTFVVNNANDVVQALSSGHNANTVMSSVSYVMPANVQTLMLTGTADLTATGSDAGGTLIANSGNDTLIAGAGLVTLVGGAGNDTFVVNNAADLIQVIPTGTNTSTAQSAVSYSLADSAQGVQNLTMTGTADVTATGNNLNNIITANSGNDVLSGGAGNDTLIAGSGADTLIGGSGVNTLYGGSGVDTYVMAFGMGSDTVIDSFGLGGIVSLQGGLTFADLTAVRQGNDLLLTIKGTSGRMLITGYYANPAATWTLHDSNNQTATIQSVLDSTVALRGQPPVTQLESNFIASIKASIFGSYLGQGYTVQANGTLHARYLSGGNQVVSYNTGTTTRTTTLQTNLDGTSSANASTGVAAQSSSMSIPVVVDETASLNVVTTNTDAAVVYADSPGWTSTTGVAWLQVAWQPAVTTVSTAGFQQASIPLYVFANGTSLDPHATGLGALVGVRMYLSGQSSISQTVTTGTVTAILPTNPGGSAVQTTVDYITYPNEIQAIDLGASNHTVYAGAYTLVNSSSGSDVIYDAGFAYGGNGNDTMYGGGTQMGGTGNDLMIGGTTMMAGSGNDTMVGSVSAYGWAGTAPATCTMIAGSGQDQMFASSLATTFQIDPTTVSTDLIGGTGDTLQFLNAFYTSLGYPNWQAFPYNWLVLYQHGSPNMYGFTEGANGIYDAQGIMSNTTMNFWRLGETIQQLLDSGAIYSVDPLPIMVLVGDGSIQPSPYYATSPTPTITVMANNFQALAQYVAQGFIPQHNVVFGPGVTAANLHCSWGQVVGSLSGVTTDPQLRYTTLNISWGSAGQTIEVMIPHSDDPLGSGVTGFAFADGSTLTMAQAMGLAPKPPTFDPQIFVFQIGMGDQIINGGVTRVEFGAGITSSMISLGLINGSLALRVGTNGDVVQFMNFNPADALAPTVLQSFVFADGTSLSYANMLAKGFDIYGTTGNEALSGTNLDNRIYAGSGNDTLIGTGANDTLVAGAGFDTLIGGAGNETFIINNTADLVQASATAASNSIQSSVSYVMPLNVQNITLTGSDNLIATGNSLNNLMVGNAGSDTLIAGSGDDTLVAGAGIASLVGGSGHDTFVINNAADVIVADPLALSNSIISSVSYVMPNNVQALTLTGSANLTATGNSLNDVITGNAGNDILYAGSGADTLVAGTGGGAMVGGSGIDTFVFGLGSGRQTILDTLKSVGDVIRFGPGITAADLNVVQQGADLLLSYGTQGDSVLIQNFTPNGASGGQVITQFLFADGSHGVYAVDAFGNTSLKAYSVTGTLVADFWQSASTGAHGSDRYLAGGASSGAVYYPDGSYNLFSNDGLGNPGSISDTLVSGSGATTLAGGLGANTFVVSNSAAVVVANPAAFSNAIWSTVDYVMPANVANLTLTGSGNLTARGNGLNDLITGNAGNDTLIGGSGADTVVAGTGGGTMIGGTGADTFVLASGSGGQTVIDTAKTGGDIVRFSDWLQAGNLNVFQQGADLLITDGQPGDSLLIKNFAPNGAAGTQVIGQFQFGNGTSGAYVNDGLGNASLKAYTAAGVLDTDFWQSQVGGNRYGHDWYSAGTLVYSDTYNPDGSYSTYDTGNPRGPITTNYDANGNVLSDYWTMGNGEQGIDAGLGHLVFSGSTADGLASTDNALFIGGLGNDAITTTTGTSVVAFNKGDGQDTVDARLGTGNTVSLGGVFAYSDLSLQHVGNNLVLSVGAADGITFYDWYTGHSSVANLQVIETAMTDFAPGSTDVLRNSNVETFDFQGLVNAFNQAQAADPTLSTWSVTNALLNAHLTSSDTAALGGDLAYTYGARGSLTGFSVATAQSELSRSQFATAPQALNPWPTLNTGTAQLA